MQANSLGITRLLRRYSFVVLVVPSLFAVCGYAYGQTVRVWVAAATATVTSPAACGTADPTLNLKICVDPETVTTKPNAQNDVELTWNLDRDDWQFDKNKGIEFKVDKKYWHTDAKVKYTWVEGNKKEGQSYTYKINLENGSKTLAYDPTIMN
jgi:hypothetical protein